MRISKRFQFTILSISDAGKFQETNRWRKHITQRTKINGCFSTRSNIEYGVLQGSILGPLIFNINMIDLFYE